MLSSVDPSEKTWNQTNLYFVCFTISSLFLLWIAIVQTPPRREFKVSDPNVRDLSLAQLSLAPSSILYLNFLDAEFNDTSLRAPLSEEILQFAQDLSIPQSEPVISTSGGEKSPSGEKSSGSPGSFGEKKIPKWLKLSKKWI